jgi:hypothetical protein
MPTRARVRRHRPNVAAASAPSAASWGRPAVPAPAVARAPATRPGSCAATTSVLLAGCPARLAAQAISAPIPRAAPATCVRPRAPPARRARAPVRPAAVRAAAAPARPAARQTSATTGSPAGMDCALPAGTPAKSVAPREAPPIDVRWEPRAAAPAATACASGAAVSETSVARAMLVPKVAVRGAAASR